VVRLQGQAGAFTQAYRWAVCALWAAAGLFALAGCGAGGAANPAQHQEGSLFRSGDTFNYSGPGALDSAAREALQYTINGIVFYLVDYRTRRVLSGGFYVSSAWNDDPTSGSGVSSRLPDGQITIDGDTALMTIELGGGPAHNGLRLSGSFSVAECNTAALQALSAMRPASFNGMDPAATFYLGRAAQPLSVSWRATGYYGATAVDVSALQELSCESYDYTLLQATP